MAFDEKKANRVRRFIECLKHTKGEFHGKPFKLLPWQDKIISDVFGTVRDDDSTMRQFTTAYIEIPKKQGKSELGAAIALNMLVNDDEWKAEVYSCASDRQQAAIVFDVQVFLVFTVGGTQDLPGGIVALTGTVNLQLYSKITKPISVEDGLRFEVIVMDGTFSTAALVAIVTVRGIVVFAFVIGLVFADDGSAALAGGEVPIITDLTEGRVIGSHVISAPDTISTMRTDHGVFVQAIRT